MKKLLLFLLLTIPLFCNGQEHLGSTMSEVKAFHPGIKFTDGAGDDGVKYTYARLGFGTFIYYFNKSRGLCFICYQTIPKENTTGLNKQVEIYNNNYTILSKSSWRAYLGGPLIMEIKLSYDYDKDLFTFVYRLVE